MIRRTARRVRRAVTGTGRWVRPGRASVALLAVGVAAAVGGASWFWTWATATAPPARTLALATSVHRGGLALDSALEVTWTWSVGGTAALEDRWLALVEPRLPPGLCPPPRETTGEAEEDGGLAAALRRLDAGVRRGASREELERRIGDVRRLVDGGAGSRTDFLVRYGLARGYAAAGDDATAAELLEPAFEGRLAPDRVPETSRERARRDVEAGRVDRALATDAFHARYLAGTLAYRRGEPELAVAYFRRAINAVYWLLALEGGEVLADEGHYLRVEADPGPAGCEGAGEPLTSLDAYAGLVASYMADADFRDPVGLRGEVARTRLQIDADDPFRAVLEHARRTGGDPERTPIPENLLWAASNLQRVYHHNRLRPDPRLEVTRAVLLLHLTRDSTWVSALRRSGGARVCAMLETLGNDLHRDAAALELGRREAPVTADSARAAVAVQTWARLERGCPDADVPVVEPPVRSAWIRLGGGYLTRGVGSRYERVRTALVSTLADRNAPVPVMEERLAPHLERIEAHRDALRRGRIPPELPADLPVEPVRRYAEEWWRAVFVDAAQALAAQARDPAPGEGIRAGEVPAYLTALESAVDHAGLRPADVYRSGEMTSLASAAGGWSGAAAWRLRTLVRNHRWESAGLLAACALVLSLLGWLVHVSWWRYRLLTGRRLYADEARARRGRAAA